MLGSQISKEIRDSFGFYEYGSDTETNIDITDADVLNSLAIELNSKESWNSNSADSNGRWWINCAAYTKVDQAEK